MCACEQDLRRPFEISLAAQLRQQSVNSQWLSQWEPSIFDPTELTSLNRSLKNVTGDYVHDFYSGAKFGGNPSMGGLLGK